MTGSSEERIADAFNAYFAVKHFTEADFDADHGIAHESMELRDPEGRVKVADGREGWLHKMTLGDVVIEAGPAAANSWTAGDEGPAGAGSFEDMLRAYMENRQPFGEAT